MSRRVVTSIAVTVLLPLILSGCMSDERDVDDMAAERETGPVEPEPATTTATERELVARVSAVNRALGFDEKFDALAYADLVAIREQLGLPESAGVSQRSNKRRLLSSFAARPLFLFEPGFWSYGRPRHPELRAGGPPTDLGPLGDLLDTGEIEIAVSSSFAFSGPGANELWRRDALVVRTRQPFEEIADRLREKHGYEEAPDGLLIGKGFNDDRGPRVITRHDGIPFPAVGQADRGVVVLGGSARAARAALAGADAGLSPAAKLLLSLPGASRVTKGRVGSPCVIAFGLTEAAMPRKGTLVAVVDEDPRAENLVYSELTAVGIADGTKVVYKEAAVGGRRVRAGFTSTDRLNATRLAIEDAFEPYHCP